MDDLSQKLADILEDPQSLERVRQMAESFLGNNSPKEETSEKSSEEFGDMPPFEDLQAIINIISHLNSQKDDKRTQLLNALKPYLSDQRKSKADNAIKLLKLFELLPLLKDSGLFKL